MPGKIFISYCGRSNGLSDIRLSIGTEQSIPEEMDHRETAVRVPVMTEV
jgi:hypothetical protein